MRGLTIVVAEASATRLRTAVTLVLAHAALGGSSRLFLDGAAVTLLRQPIQADDDALYEAAGQPALAGLIAEALEAGVTITLCQTGLHVADTSAREYDQRLQFGGMIALLTTLADDRLVVL